MPAADTDTQITDNGTVIRSAAIKLTTRPDGTAETLLINQTLARSFGITVKSDGNGGFTLTGTATLAQYQQVIGSLQYSNNLTFPNSTDRVIAVTVNDGISNSNTAVSRLSFLGGSVATVNKQLYLSDPGQGMDRVDPVATGDTTTSSVAVMPVVSPDSTGMATWSNSSRKNLEYRPWNLTAFATPGTTATDGGSYETMASAASAKRNEAVVVGVTTDKHVSGSIWNGSSWTPIAINIGGTVTQKLGAPSQPQWWGAAVAYETNSGRAMLVWNTGATLNFSLWNGTSWTNAATIPAYTGTEPRQIRIAANPLAGSNEIVITVTDKNEVDRALVWNGSSWGNQIQVDNNGSHNFTDANVVYEQQTGRAMVVYASGTAGAVGYNLWNGSAWSAPATLAAPAGSNNYAQWTVVAGDPNSNRIVLGVESNGKDAWINVWNGTAWGTSTLGVQDGVDNNNNLEIAVAFESKSGDALAVYQNNENTNTTELQFRTFTAGAWSAGTNFGNSFNNKVSRAITLNSNPYSDQIMLMVNDDIKDLRADLWTGSAFAPFTQLEANTNSQNGQPFSFFWDRYLPGTVTTSTTFTQTAPMAAPFVVPQGAAVKVTTYIQLISGTLPASPKLAVSLSQGGTNAVTLPAPPTVTALGGGIFKLEWTGTIPNNVTVPTGNQISLTLTDFDSSYAFNILYDSNTFPSQVQLATVTGIAVDSLNVYGAAYPAGSPITSTPAGLPAFVRFTLSDPFGASDITGADVVIKNSSGATVLSTTLTDANVVASTAGTKTYELAWTPPQGDTFSITVTAHEGTEGVTATRQTAIIATAAPDLVVSKSDGGATVSAGGTVAYTINYSNAGLANATGVVLTEFLPPGTTFNTAASTPGWVALGSGAFRFAIGNLGVGANGSVVFAVTMPSPVPAALEQISNTVQITDDGTHGADTNPNNNLGVDDTPVNAAPDLVITKSDGGTSTLAGGVVLYQITYSNVGTQNADGVVITEQLPANTTFNSASSFGAWDSEGGGLFALSIGNLAAGASGTATFAVNVASPLPGGVTQIANTVSIADAGDGGPDPTPANNTASDTTPIVSNPQADLQITKTDGLVNVQPGGAVTYTITVTNAGPNAVIGAAFTDNVPALLMGVTFTTTVAGGAGVTPASGSGNSISGTLNVPVGGTVTYTVKGTLNPTAIGTLTNFATVLPPAGLVDPNTGNNTAVDSDPIVPIADVSLGKSFTFTDLDGSGTLTPGDRIVFAVTATNSGPNPAYNLTVEDLLPNGYQYVSDDAAINGGTYAIGTGIWTIGKTIGATTPGNTAVLHITAIVGPGGTYANVAQVHSSDSFDPDSTPDNDVTTEDDYATVTPPVQPKSDLSLDKTLTLTSDLDGSGDVSIGDRVTFTLTLNNLGPTDAANVHVKDLLPAGYTFFSATANQGTYTSGSGDWNVGTVTVLSTPTLSIVATLVGGKPTSAYTNYAQVSASGSFDPDSTPNNNSSTEDDNAVAAPFIADLSVTKTAVLDGDNDESGTLTVGDDVVFIVTVTNAGPDFANGVELVDKLTAGFTYVSDDSGGAYDPVTGKWLAGVVAPGASRTLSISANVNTAGPYTNTAQVTVSQQFDPDSTPNNNVTSEDDQTTITLTPGAAAQSPVAVNDSSLHNSAGPVTLNVTANDTDPNLDIDPNTVDLDPSTAGQQTTRTVAGQGTWTADSDGNVTFTPVAGFTKDPTPITYTVNDATGRVSNQATITIDYVPVATNDSSSGNTTGTAVTVPVLANDTTGDIVVATTVQIVGTPFPGAPLVVPGQGTWSVNTTTGAITFTPAAGFTGDPTPIQYTVQDDDGNTSNPATVTVDYVQLPPVAVNDSSLNNAPGPVTLNVTGNDTDPNNDIDPATVDLDPATPGRQTTRTVPGEGFWQVDDLGNVTFFPVVGFASNPTPINYTVQDKTGLVSNPATVTITYVYPADLAVTKVVSNPTPNVGDTITFTVTLTNNGPQDATGVRVTDTLPPGLTFVSATPSQGTYIPASGLWIVGAVPAGASRTLAIAARVDSPNAATNTATVSALDQVDPNTGNNTGSATETPQQANLAVAKTVSNPTPNVGDQITFTITLSNAGPNAATNVLLRDLLPAGLTFVSATPSQGTYTAATGVWTVGTVSAGVPQTLQLVATVVSPQARTNTAQITDADQYDPDGNNNQASATETPKSADLAVMKSVSNATPNVGDQITFTVTLTNGGSDNASGVQVTDLLPAGLTFVSANPSQGTYTSGTGLWIVGAVANGAIATLTLTTTVTSPATRTNTATITHADQFDPNTGNNSGSATETPQQADLSIDKSVSNPTPNVGDTITFTLTASNAGPDAATGVSVTDLLPAGVTFVSANPSQGTYNSGTGIWATGTIASGAAATLVITATVVAPASIVNTATITGKQFDPNTGNNTDSTSADPQAADIAVSKAVSDATPNVGDQVTFTVTLTNTGPHSATNVQVTDLLPAGLTFVSAAPSQGTYTPGTGLWNVGTVATGATLTLAIVAKVVSPAARTNTATISHADQFDPNTANNTASATETPEQADMRLTKSVSNPQPDVGDVVTFTITLTDLGPDAATNVLVNDLLPAGLSFVSATPSQGSYNSATGVWNAGTVAPAAAATLLIQARVDSPNTRNNTASIGRADQFDPNTANNSASAAETPLQADLALTKVVSDATPNVGDTITFTVTITNNGPDAATNVQVTDVLPPGLTYISGLRSQGGYDPATGIWSVGTVDPGTPQTLTLLARVDVAEARTNTATVTASDRYDPDSSNNQASVTETPQQADLRLTKSVNNARPNVGDTITFTVRLTNAGPNDATDVTVRDLLPPGLTLVAAAPVQGTYAPASGLWDVGTVTAGATTTLILQAKVVSPLGQTNTATITAADQFDPNGGNNQASATETPLQADVVVFKRVSNPTPNVGDTITYTIRVTNAGPDNATGVVLQDLLPAGTNFVSATATQGTYNPVTGVWTVGTVLVEGPQTLTIAARVVSPDAKTNTASIADADQFDPNTANNTDTAEVDPQVADLLVTKSVSDATPNVGDQITFTVTLVNSGPHSATGVRVTDLLPPGLTFVSAAPAQGTYTSSTGIWNVGTRTSGAQTVLTLTATVASPLALTNTATISAADQFDPNTANNTGSATETPQHSDLVVTKSVSDATPNVGDNVTFTVTLSNGGPDDATGVQVTDLLPPGLTFVSAAPSQGTYNSGSGLWNVGTVSPGAAQTLQIVATVTSPAAQTNTATVTDSDQFDPNTGNNTGSVTETPQQSDLSLTKTVSDATPNVGDTITFTVTLTNSGPDAAAGVQVADLLPAGLTLVLATPSQGAYDSPSGLWSVGNVNAAASATLTLQALVASPIGRTNTATITDSDQFDPNTGNNTASATESPQQADLAVAKSVSDATPNVGDTITFTVTLTNNGPDAATNVSLRDSLPAGLTFVFASASQGSYDASVGRWTVGTVAPGVPQTLQILATVVSGAPRTNTAALDTADQFDPNTGNNTASAAETPQRSDLSLTKSVSNATPNVGDQITFTVKLTNNGPDAATGVRVTDLLPVGLAFVSANPSQGTYTSGTGLWDVGTVAPATPLTLAIVATVVSSGAQTNTATVSDSDQFDPNTGNNSGSATETPQQSDLSIAKSVSNPTPNVGDTIVFTLSVSNAGPDAATGVTVTDLLPAGVTFVSASASQGTYSSATGLWTVGTVAPGATPTLAITVKVTAPGSVINTAAIDGDQFDPNTSNNTDSTTANPQAADLAVTKVVSDATPNVGDQVTFTVTLTNSGPHSATNVQVTDLLPAGLTFVSAAPSQGTYTPGTGLWTVGTVASGGRLTLAIIVTVTSPAARTNTATVTRADQFDPNTANNTGSATETPQHADLAVTKSVNDATPNVGDTVTFTITLTDSGPDAATGVRVNDLLPAGLTFVSATQSQGTYTPGTGLWNVGTVSPSSPAILQIVATVTSPDPRTNTATVAHADQFDPVTGNNSGSATETPQRADLALTKSVSDPTPNVGNQVSFTVTLTNNGPDVATGVRVTDLLPAGLTFVSATTSTGNYNGITGLWTVGTLASGAAATLTIQATVVSPDPRTNTATVAHADQFDPATADNSASATETPQRADLAVIKTVSDSTPNVGDTITFTVTLTNNGSDAATGVTLTDLLPAGLAFLGATPSQGLYDSATGVWLVGTVTPGSPETLAITARVASSAAQTNIASVSASDQFDPNTTNNSGRATESPQRADLAIVKSVNNPTPNVGDTITFTVILTNSGPDAATGVTVDDLLPAGLTFVSAAPGQGTYSPATGVWNVGTVRPGNPLTLTLKAVVNDAAAQTNTAAVGSADQFDPNTANNTGSATETPQQADLAVTKSVSDSTPNVGDVITFTVTVTNQGPDAATNVQLTDALPPGLTPILIQPDRGTFGGQVWTVGTLAAGATGTLTLLVRVDSPDAQTNIAAISHSDQFDPTTANNTAGATETPEHADLALTKTVSDSTPNVGDQITFTVTLSNNGPDPATAVSVADQLPAGLTFVSAAPSQGNYNPATGVWTVGTVAPFAALTLAITATVVSPLPHTNTAAVAGADQFDPVTGNNTASATETPQRADLALTKTVSDSTPNVGDQITFTVTLSNTGPDAATGVKVDDLLPAGLTFVSAAPGQGTYSPATGVWDVGTVNPGTPLTLTLTATVASPNTQTNTATIAGADQFDPDSGDNTASATETPQQADLSVTKSVSNPTPNVGDTITYTITVRNSGPDAATGVTVADQLPAGVTFQSASASQGAYDQVAGVWTVGTVASGAAPTLTITVLVVGAGSLVNTATASGDQFDPNPGNNTGSTSADPLVADLVLVKSVSNPRPNVGDTVTFTVTLTNAGPAPATGVQVTDLLPAGLTFVSATPGQGTYSSGTGVWMVGTVNPGVPLTLTLTATVVSPAARTNTATITASDQFDPNTGNNTASATETPRQSDLRVTKTVSDSTPNVGDTITFTIDLTNAGPDTATGVLLTDLLPSGLTLVSAAPSQGTYNPTNGVWTVGPVSPGAALKLTLSATVVSPSPQTNTATVTDADQFDPNTGNNTASATETPQQADLRVTKTVSDSTPNVGDTITFTVTVTNLGPDIATGVQLTDLLPPGLTPVLARAASGAYDPATGIWDVGTVLPGDTHTLTLTATVISSAARTNTATITAADQFDPVTSNNTASATETPQRADLALTKTVSDSTPNVGDTITFTITLNNAGPGAGTGVTVNDLLPAGLTFVSAAPSQGTYSPVTGVWDVGAVSPGTPLTLTLTAVVNTAAAQTNTTAIGGADQFDPVTGNNTASAVEIPQQSDLRVTKTVSDSTPNVGDTITFTVAVSNSGPNAATGVQLTDVLPTGLTFVSATPNQGTYDPATGLWVVGTLANGAAATLTLRAVVASPDALTNLASISAVDQFDPNPGNNTAGATETPELADLVVTKTVNDLTPNVGDTVTFTVAVTNTGPSAATGVRLKDLLPAGLTFVSATPSQGAYASATGIWNVGSVASGAQAVLTLQARVTNANPITNAAGVTAADQFDPDTSNNTASSTVTPQRADLAVTKVVSDASPNLGDVIAYTITLTNLGPDGATGVKLRDRLPAGLAFMSAIASQGTYDSATGIWTVGSLANGGAATLVLDARVTSTAPGTNVATVAAADQFDPETRNNTANAPLSAQQVDLVVGKSVNNARPNQDEVITFTVSVTNRGPNTATNVSLSDVVPAGLVVVSVLPSQGIYDAGTGVWDVGAVTTVIPATLQISARVTTPAVKLNRAAIISLDQPDANPANNSDQVTVAPRRADLAVTKTVNDPRPDVGDTVTFTVRVTNKGPDAATGVQLTDVLPAGLTLVSAVPNQGTYDSASGTWVVGTVNNGAAATLLLRALVADPAGATNTATVSATDPFDMVPSNDSGSATITPRQADLNLTKTVSIAKPNVGDTVTFTIALHNSGPDAAQGVTVTDLLPPGLTFVSATPSAGTYDPASGDWALASVANGATATLQIRATVDAAGSATNTGTITGSGTFDPDPADNQSSATVVPQQADLVVTKAVDKPSPNVGDTVAFTVTATNTGPDAATNVRVTDLLPPGLTFVSATPSQGTYASATGLWTVGTLASAATAALVLRATVTIPGALSNSATGSADQFDPDLGNNGGSANISPQQADLVLGKSVDNPLPNVGDTIAYTILVRNAGPDTATNVRVTDALPAGLTFVSATPTQGAYDSATGVWAVGTLAVNGEARLTITAVATSANLQLNVARVTGSDQFDPDTDNNVAEAAVDPQEAELVLTKTVDNPRPNVGDTVTFTVTLSGLGPDPATGVQVTDALPPGVSFVSANPSQGTFDPASGVWDVGTVPAGATPVLTIMAMVNSPDAQLNTAAITHADQPDPNPQNNDGQAAIIPQKSDLAVFKAVDDAKPNVGDVVTFTVTLSNLGKNTATNVALTDLLPAGLAFVSATPSQGDYDSGTGVWSVGTVTTGVAQTLVLRATVTSANPATNIAAVTQSDQFDPDLSNNQDQAGIGPQQSDLQVLKTVNNSRPNVGDVVTFTVTLNNLGVDVATGVALTDLIPAGLTFVSAAPDQGTYAAATGLWSVGTVLVGQPVDLILRARLTAPGATTNTATISAADQFDPNQGNNMGGATVTPRQADLVVAKVVDTARPNVGDVVTFTVTVTNIGPDDATGVSINDALPAGLAFVSANPSQGSYAAGAGMWAVGTVPAGGSATLQLTARVLVPQPLTNIADIASAAEFDPNLGNNTASADVRPQVADVVVAKVVDNPRPFVGGTVTFTITVTNHGPDAADGVVVTDFMPVNLKLVLADPSVGIYDPATGTWTVGTLANGQTETLKLTATVTSGAAATNLVAVLATQFDPDKANNAAAAAVVPPQADVRVAKTVSSQVVTVGQNVVYTIVVRNAGPDAATNVVLTDGLPAGLTLVGINQITQGTYDRSTGRWTVGTLAPGATARLRFTVRVSRVGTITNVATATLNEFDPILRNNRSGVSIVVRPFDPSKFWFVSG
ncbi:MAG TPA: hypothetical protein VHR66_30050 [Gemmataceae bacterium]|nr:hypothetical protein [Gemmataceae bacterium]